jgi:Skp family chaperone for outer membrane proteins
MRTEIERRKAAGEEAVQKISAQSAEESRQMQSGVQALRDELEKERAKHAQAQQSDRRSHRDVVAEFERTVQELRAHLEVHHGQK